MISLFFFVFMFGSMVWINFSVLKMLILNSFLVILMGIYFSVDIIRVLVLLIKNLKRKKISKWIEVGFLINL